MKLQFRLRTLMIVVTLLAVPLGYVGWQAKIVRERTAWRANPHFAEPLLIDDGGTVPWVRRLLGDAESFGMLADESVSDEDLERCQVAFPETHVSRNASFFRALANHRLR